MRYFLKIPVTLVLVFFALAVSGQDGAAQPAFILTILGDKGQPVEAATVEMLQNGKLVKAAITDAKGQAGFEKIEAGSYTFSISSKGYQATVTEVYTFPATGRALTINLQIAGATLKEVSVSAKKPFIQNKQGKVILNVESAVTNVGSTVLEVLEKSPGVMVDRNGGIALQGKTGVLVLIDDKPTYLSGADLNNLVERATERALADALKSGNLRDVTHADFLSALKEVKPSTTEWLRRSRNYVNFANQDGLYEDLARYLDEVKIK